MISKQYFLEFLGRKKKDSYPNLTAINNDWSKKRWSCMELGAVDELKCDIKTSDYILLILKRELKNNQIEKCDGLIKKKILELEKTRLYDKGSLKFQLEIDKKSDAGKWTNKLEDQHREKRKALAIKLKYAAEEFDGEIPDYR